MIDIHHKNSPSSLLFRRCLVLFEELKLGISNVKVLLCYNTLWFWCVHVANMWVVLCFGGYYCWPVSCAELAMLNTSRNMLNSMVCFELAGTCTLKHPILNKQASNVMLTVDNSHYLKGISKHEQVSIAFEIQNP